MARAWLSTPSNTLFSFLSLQQRTIAARSCAVSGYRCESIFVNENAAFFSFLKWPLIIHPRKKKNPIITIRDDVFLSTGWDVLKSVLQLNDAEFAKVKESLVGNQAETKVKWCT